MKRTCKQCGEEFILSRSEVAFYKEKKLTLPRRCKKCREQNKQQKEQINEEAGVNEEVRADSQAKPKQENKAKNQTVPKYENKFQGREKSKQENKVKGQAASKYENKSQSREKSKYENKSKEKAENKKQQTQDRYQEINQQETKQEVSQDSQAAAKETVKTKSKKLYAAIALALCLLGGAGGIGALQSGDNASDTAIEYEADVQDSIGDAVVEDESGSQGERDGAVENETEVQYIFRNDDLLQEHYEKHGIEMGFEDAESYLAAANAVVTNPEAMHKIEQEDGDDVYYLEATNEFVVISTDGYLRTYFYPEDGVDYFNRQ